MEQSRDQERKGGKFYTRAQGRKSKFTHFPLRKEIIEMLNELNCREPTQIQADSMPITLQQNLRDLCIVAYAYNGAGKTLTFLLPILNSLENVPCGGKRTEAKGNEKKIIRPQAFIVVPTEVLALQIYGYLTDYATFFWEYYRWRVEIGKQFGEQTSEGHINIGMVSNVYNFFNRQDIDLSIMKWVVFDEADEIKSSFPQQFPSLLQRLNKKTDCRFNLLFTSATGEKQSFRSYLQQRLQNHSLVQLDSKIEGKGLEGVNHFYAKEQDKSTLLTKLFTQLSKLQHKFQIVVFFNTAVQLKAFYADLHKGKPFAVNQPSTQGLNLMVEYIHGSCGKFGHTAEDRARNKEQRMLRFGQQQATVLLATEMIARGIDVRTISIVINFNEPKRNQVISAVTYIHRVGRTGRYSDQGLAVTFVKDDLLVRLVEANEKVKFAPAPSAEELIRIAIRCAANNKNQAANALSQ